MTSRIFFVFLTAVTTVAAFAQSPDALQKEAMKKFDKWVGVWKGEAVASMGPGRQDTAIAVETVRKDLDGTIIFVEGVGRRKLPGMQEGEVGHHAFGVISYDEKKKSYRMHTWRIPGGSHNNVEPTISDSGYEWGMEIPRGKLRYKAVISDDGRWEETGEFSADGNTWYPIFKMFLKKVE